MLYFIICILSHTNLFSWLPDPHARAYIRAFQKIILKIDWVARSIADETGGF